MLKHPAHLVDFDTLLAGLRAARESRHVFERRGPDGLVLFVYSEHCVYDAAWTPTTIAARGLILHPETKRIVATPFPKFFNLGERGEPVPDLPFEVMEKLDGSLIIIFHHEGRWRTATKGAFDSSQALWAQARLDGQDLSPLEPGVTYLAEATYPENRIVVRYETPALVMLGAYDKAGDEVPPADLARTAAALGWRTAERYPYGSIADLVAEAKLLPKTREGFVIRFENGLRLKVKGDAYKRIHALISRITPLAIWEIMAAGDDLEAIRREIPEEFWGDFDRIVELLSKSAEDLVARVAETARMIEHLSDKEVGLSIGTLDPVARTFVFPYRKSGGDLTTGRTRQLLFRTLRPTGNELPGYVPSYAMRRVNEEAV